MRVLSRKEREDRANRAFDDQQTSVWRMDHHVEWTEARVAEAESEVQRPEGQGDEVQRSEAPPAKVQRSVRQRPEMRRAKAEQRAPRPPRTLAQRRTRTLSVLAGLTVLTLLAAVVGVLPIWTALPFVAMLGSFVVHLRIQARQREQRHRVPRPTAAVADRQLPDRPVEDVQQSTRQDAPREEVRRERAASMFVPGPSRAMVVETKGAGRSEVGNAPADAPPGDDDEETWRPEPLPLPTYVTAPKAMRPIKVIDLTTPGAWSSGRLLDDGLAEEDLLAAQVEGEELDALLEHEAAPEASRDGKEGNGDRRAVGD
jgi:hypothetical protein